MISKRIKIIVISGIIIICLSGCGKQEQNNNVDINLPNQSTITSETITESPTTETKKQSK